MCGISGIMVAEGGQIDQSVLRRMTDQIAHRGPDGEGFHWGRGVALGHRRLAILDETGGVQPMYGADDQVVITYNGEIYNFQLLRRELELLGHVFRTDHSDTEVLLHAYLEWGRECVNRLRGMFAFAIWDNRTGELMLARDRLGIKPIYHCTLPDGTFLFGSELKALLAYPGIPRKLRLDALEDYLALGYVPDPKTIIDGIQKLSAGHILIRRRGQMHHRPERYWAPDVSTPPVKANDEGEFLERLEEAVKMRMVADVPLGAFLSGGIDSSTVVGLMSRNNPEPVETCAIGSEDPAYDESGFAQMAADHFGTHHRLRLSSARDGFLLKRMAQVFDEPFADLSALPTYRVCGLASEKVKVALSGDGGDELFAGYRRYRFHMMEEGLRAGLPEGFRRTVFGTLARVYPKLDRAPKFLRAKSTFEALARSSVDAYFQSVSRTPDRERLRLHSAKMTARLAGYHPHETFRDVAAEVPGAHPLSMVQYIDFMTWLPGDILTKVDRASMAHSLEVRVPILDHKFVEWGLRFDPDSRIHEGEGKSIFKRAVRGFLPDQIIDRPKRGFDVPAVQWLRHELAPELEKLQNSEILMDTGLLDRRAIARMADEHLRESRDHHATLWSLLTLDRSLKRLELDTGV
ncbi:MAG: amidotransferase 1, exosortase A system-associated [Alphaproteobacteria bacterium]|nr:MAG: amidotransferase 1, exosortase A system-associated [Alphaproteobacteria bacterium]